MAQIHELKPKLMKAIGPILKEQEMSGGPKYKFRGIDQVLPKVQAALLEFGCMIAIKASDFHVERYEKDKGKWNHSATLLMEVKFIAPDGSEIGDTAAGEGLDTNGDKATYKAMSGAFKYACFLGLCIPTNTLEDPDSRRRPKNDRPVSPTDTAEKAIKNAPDEKTISRYLTAAKAKFTDDEYLFLFDVASERRRELGIK